MPTADSAARLATPKVSSAIRNPGQTSIFRSTSPTVASAPRPASTAVAPIAASAGSTGGGTGGTGGSYGSVGGYAAPAPAPRRSLQQIIDEDFALRQTRDEAARQEAEFNAETGRLRGETERDQAVRREELATDLEDMTLDSSESLAARGLLNSGGFFLNQDKIDAEGGRRENSIADMLTNLLAQRGQGLLGVQAQGRNMINDRIANLTRDYGAGIGGY